VNANSIIAASIMMVVIVTAGWSASISDSDTEDPFVIPDRASATTFCWQSFQNISGMSVTCTVSPVDGTHMIVDYALSTNESSMRIGDRTWGIGSHGSTELIAIDEPITVYFSGADAYPNDERADYFVIRVIPHA